VIVKNFDQPLLGRRFGRQSTDDVAVGTSLMKNVSELIYRHVLLNRRSARVEVTAFVVVDLITA
jgi:hypothetical protein